MWSLKQIIKDKLCELGEHWAFNESTAIFLASKIAQEIQVKQRKEELKEFQSEIREPQPDWGAWKEGICDREGMPYYE